MGINGIICGAAMSRVAKCAYRLRAQCTFKYNATYKKRENIRVFL